jgi:hypothetical protein
VEKINLVANWLRMKETEASSYPKLLPRTVRQSEGEWRRAKVLFNLI